MEQIHNAICSGDIETYLKEVTNICFNYNTGTIYQRETICLNVLELGLKIDEFNVQHAYLFLGIMRSLKRSITPNTGEGSYLDLSNKIASHEYKLIVNKFVHHLLITDESLTWPDILTQLVTNSVSPEQLLKATEVLKQALEKNKLFWRNL